MRVPRKIRDPLIGFIASCMFLLFLAAVTAATARAHNTAAAWSLVIWLSPMPVLAALLIWLVESDARK